MADRERREFLNREARSLIEFEYRAIDSWHPENTGGRTSRSYRCDCGFTTPLPSAIYDHVCAAPADAHEYESACRYCGAPDGVACLPGCREGAEDDGDSCESLGLVVR
jgi:hypothetical protein